MRISVPARALAVLSILLGLASPALAGDEAADARASVLARAMDVLDLVEQQRISSAREWTRRLVEMGPDALPAVWLAYQGWGSGERNPVGRRVLIDTFRSMPGEAVHRFLLEMAGEGARAGDRLMVLRLLAELPSRGSLDVATGVLAGFSNRELESPALRSAVAAGLGSILDRDETAYLPLVEVYRELSGPGRRTILLAAERSSRSAAFRFLLRVLSIDRSLDREVLLALSRRPVLGPESPSAREVAAVRLHLAGADVAAKAAAALAAGRLHDADSAELLVGLLEEDDRGLRSAATTALRRLSGLGMRADARVWRRWLEEERSWLASDMKGDLAALAAKTGEILENALRTLGRHRLHRDAVMPTLLTHLEHKSPKVRRAACDALRALASPQSIPELVSATSDPESEVGAAANAALREVTARSAADESGWRSTLDLR